MKILIPVDYSEPSFSIIEYVAEYGLQYEAHLIFLQILNDTKPNDKIKQSIIDRDEFIKRYFDTTKCDTNQLNFSFDIITAPNGEMLINKAIQANIDLIIMKNQFITYESESLFKDIIRNANCPVMIVPPKRPFKKIRKIAYAMDHFGFISSSLIHTLKWVNIYNSQINYIHVGKMDEKSEKDIFDTIKELTSEESPIIDTIQALYVNNDLIKVSLEKYCLKEQVDLLTITHRKERIIDKLFGVSNSIEIALETSVPLMILHESNHNYTGSVNIDQHQSAN